MTTLELKVTLPESVAEEAKTMGLLQPEALERLLREAIRRHHVEQLFVAADRLAAVEKPPLTEAEVEAEIRAARNERRSKNARGG